MYSLPSTAIAVSFVLTAAPSYPVPVRVPKMDCDASPPTPTHVTSAADLSCDSPAGPGAAGQSWKKPLLMVTARPFLSLATFWPWKPLLVTSTKKASLAAELHHWLNSELKKEKSNTTVCTLLGTFTVRVSSAQSCTL